MADNVDVSVDAPVENFIVLDNEDATSVIDVVSTISIEPLSLTAEGNPQIIEVDRGEVGPVGPQGLQGVQGVPGVSGFNPAQVAAIIQQGIPERVWNIIHTLQYIPTVVIVDSAGSVVEGDVRYINGSQIEVSFAVPFSGTVYLS